MSENIIAENFLSQIYEEGHCQILLDEIIDHRRDGKAIQEEYRFRNTSIVYRRSNMTTKAWNLCVKWKYGSSNWISLKNIKDYYPVKLADYSINNNIKDKTDLSLWVPYVINKRYAIPAKVKSKYWKITHKYGTKIIKYVNEAYKINADNRN